MQREELEAELRAIEQWDELYRQTATHNDAEELSFQIRQELRMEIMQKIQAFANSTR